VDRFEGWFRLLRDSLSPEPLRAEATDLREMLGDVVKALRPLLDRTRVGVAIDVESRLGEVHVDRLHFPQAVLALVTNAVEASAQGQHVRIEARSAPEGAGAWRLSIVDAGTGVPPELRDRIFQPFFTTKVQGNGIGLALAAKVVTLHGGTLELGSMPGGGSRFTATFPRTPSLPRDASSG